MTRPVLHGYYRSSASYRVRIALNLKGIEYDDVFHHLRKGEQIAPAYVGLNPQGLVPALEWQGAVLTQSLAICEYLDEFAPDPALLPHDPLARAQVRAFAQIIACDVHPIQNLKILKRLRELGHDQAEIDAWACQVMVEGLGACDRLISERAGPFCFGRNVTLADICLIPQLANAKRFGIDIERWPRLAAVEEQCLSIDAFQRARPESQADAE